MTNEIYAQWLRNALCLALQLQVILYCYLNFAVYLKSNRVKLRNNVYITFVFITEKSFYNYNRWILGEFKCDRIILAQCYQSAEI